VIDFGPEDVLRVGPLLLFAMAVAETAVPAGLLVPAGVAFSTGVFLAHQGLIGWEGVLLAPVAGALVGDSLGYWLGRRSSPLLQRTPGRLGRLVLGARRRSARIFETHALLAVTGGRTVSFVRTFMPATAGASGVPYPRFLLFDGAGVAVWAVLYVALGIGAAEGWQALAGRTGPGLAAFVLLALLVLAAGLGIRRWKGRGALAGPRSTALHVGLTGNVASGKSTVAAAWERAGVPVVSADELARRAVEPGTPGLAEVVEAFGRELLTPEGTLDRAALRERVFADDAARRRLESILHPRIAALRREWARAREKEGERLLVSEVPLLFEVGLFDAFDRVVVVHAPPEERRRRLVEGRGIEPEEAERIMAAQGDPDEKRRRAHHILDNRGAREELEAEALRLLARLRALAEET
jgi:dephospho-CoA kinase